MTTAVAVGTYRAACHKTRHAAGHPQDCTCGTFVTCDITTDQPDLFAEHMLIAHKFKSYRTHQEQRSLWFTGENWDPKPAPKVRYSKTPFEPKPFEPGDNIVWVDSDHQVRTGQVWSGHALPKTRWVVANGNAYPVRERELIDNWLSTTRAVVERYRRDNNSTEHGYWITLLTDVERQLTELEQAA